MDNGSILRRPAAVWAALLATALASTGAAQQDEDAGADAVAGPRDCLNHPNIRRTKILSARNIVFVMRDDTIYNNQLPKDCPSLNRSSLVNFAIVNKRVCAGDRFRVLMETQPGSFTPTFLCPLGAFVPITESELEDLTTMTAPEKERRSRQRSTREAVTTEQIELPPSATAPAPAPAESSPAGSEAPRE